MNALTRSKVNWPTSSGGLFSVLMGSAVLIQAYASHQTVTTEMLTTNLGLIAAGLSLLFARSAGSTSEQNGVTASPLSVEQAKEVTVLPKV